MASSSNFIQNMLLIEDPSILAIKNGIAEMSYWFLPPAFVTALILEYFGELKFYEVVKKLILILVFMAAFFSFHKEGVALALSGSEELLREVSPNNLFIKKWMEIKIRTKEDQDKGDSIIKSIGNFIVPNFNDFVATTFFVLSKLCLVIVRLIYSTVYHLTYIFAPLTALLFFFPITRGALGGSIISSLWCMILPFVLVAIFAVVGNSFLSSANSAESVISNLDQILWFFGLCSLIALSPIFTMGVLKGSGISMAATASTMMMLNTGSKIISRVIPKPRKSISFSKNNSFGSKSGWQNYQGYSQRGNEHSRFQGYQGKGFGENLNPQKKGFMEKYLGIKSFRDKHQVNNERFRRSHSSFDKNKVSKDSMSQSSLQARIPDFSQSKFSPLKEEKKTNKFASPSKFYSQQRNPPSSPYSQEIHRNPYGRDWHYPEVRPYNKFDYRGFRSEAYWREVANRGKVYETRKI